MRRLLLPISLMLPALLASFLNPSRLSANSDAPAWMHAAAARSLPGYDDKTNAVYLYAEDIITVQSNGKIRKTERRAVKIIRPEGREHAKLRFFYDAETKSTASTVGQFLLKARITKSKEKEVTDSGYTGAEEGALATDLRSKNMELPAANPGNIIGWEIEQDWRPYILQDRWNFSKKFPFARPTTRSNYRLPGNTSLSRKPSRHRSVHFQWPVFLDRLRCRPGTWRVANASVAGRCLTYGSFYFAAGGDQQGFCILEPDGRLVHATHAGTPRRHAGDSFASRNPHCFPQ